jgi:hypothetical protein
MFELADALRYEINSVLIVCSRELPVQHGRHFYLIDTSQ